MKVVIFAGGLGSRLSEETESKPKPMVEIGGRPILWHIMKHYAHHGLKEFVVALGYRGEVIKRWFLDMAELDGSFTLSLGDRRVERHDRPLDDWKLMLMDTGVETQTGGRLARVAPLLRDGTFMLTYGDGLCDVDLGKLLAFHRAHGKLATVTAVRPPARFGELQFDGDLVKRFSSPSSARLDQRRLLRARAGGSGSHPRRRALGARAARAARGGGTAHGLQARELLAVHGHVAREAHAGLALGERARAVESLALSDSYTLPGAASTRS
jgi:glucose-1-phosphate cytidylyltransferase